MRSDRRQTSAFVARSRRNLLDDVKNQPRATAARRTDSSSIWRLSESDQAQLISRSTAECSLYRYSSCKKTFHHASRPAKENFSKCRFKKSAFNGCRRFEATVSSASYKSSWCALNFRT